MTTQARLQELKRLLSEATTVTHELEALTGGQEAAPSRPQPGLGAAVGGLDNPKAFFDALRASDKIFGGKLVDAQIEGIVADLAVGAGRLPTSWMAYCLATDYHETGHTMQPVAERGSGDGPDADSWDDYLQKYDTGKLAAALGNTPEADGDGVFYMGRGKVQLTGARNYKFATQRLQELGILKPGEDLTKTPDLARRMDIATAILIFGSLEGWFTSKTLRHYLKSPATRDQFKNARKIINGTDRDDLIAGYALAFQEALIAGNWK